MTTQVSPDTVHSAFERQPRNVSTGEQARSAGDPGQTPWFDPPDCGTQRFSFTSLVVESSMHEFGLFGSVPAGAQKHFLPPPITPLQFGLAALSVSVSVPLDPSS